jgi:hypothetical protein
MKKMIIALFALVSSFAMAADSSSGCGMGWQVFKDQSLVSSTLRTTVNLTFLNTIAMTLGTSGCAKHSIVKIDMQGVHYAEANMNSLTIEMARGNGEYLAGFANVFGCTNVNAFGSMVQNKYESVLPSNNVSGVELYNNVKKEIRNNAELASSCSII